LPYNREIAFLISQVNPAKGVAHPLTREEAVDRLRKIGPDAIPYLIDDLANPDSLTWIALARLGPQAVPELLTAATSPNDNIRLGAIMSFSFMNPVPAAAVPVLIRALDGGKYECYTAAVALGRIGAAAEPALPHLSRVLRQLRFLFVPDDQVAIQLAIRRITLAVQQKRSAARPRGRP
jgi:HEAT repeat protein